MNHKALLGTAIAAALMFGAQAASACAISAWTSATGLTVADTGDPTVGGGPTVGGFKRYSGSCSLRVNSANGATGRYVLDGTPGSETSYRLRFMYFTGNLSGGTADIFQARNSGGTNIIRVTHDGTNMSVSTTGGTPATFAVNDNAWYTVELAWASAAGTGSLTGTVRGAGSTTAAGTINITGLNNGSDRIDEARLGLAAGTPSFNSTAIYFDEFDSRRTQNPGRLCRGDAGGGAGGAPDGILNVFDIGAMVGEIQAPTNPANLVKGQPDFNEDGILNVFDIGAIVPAIVAVTPCSAT